MIRAPDARKHIGWWIFCRNSLDTETTDVPFSRNKRCERTLAVGFVVEVLRSRLSGHWPPGGASIDIEIRDSRCQMSECEVNGAQLVQFLLGSVISFR